MFNSSLAQIELADRLEYDHAWVVEHHFLEEYSHSSAPEVFLGAATQRTRRIRLGHGQGPVELHPFGARVREKRDVWEEAVRALIPAFTEHRWEWHGKYFDFPARNVIPKPYQKPHPPLWVACSNITTIGSAGQWGMGALGFQF